jgi:hypothetical protein
LKPEDALFLHSKVKSTEPSSATLLFTKVGTPALFRDPFVKAPRTKSGMMDGEGDAMVVQQKASYCY